MKEAVTKVIDMLIQEDFHGALQKSLELYNKCIASGGDYFEGDKSFMCVLSIKVPIRKKSGNLFHDSRMYLSCPDVMIRIWYKVSIPSFASRLVREVLNRHKIGSVTYLKWKNTTLFVPSLAKAFVFDGCVSAVSWFNAAPRSVLLAPAGTVRPSGPCRIMLTHYRRRRTLFTLRDYITFVINLWHIAGCCIRVWSSRDMMSATSS